MVSIINFTVKRKSTKNILKCLAELFSLPFKINKERIVLLPVDDQYVDYAESSTFAMSNKIFGPVAIYYRRIS